MRLIIEYSVGDGCTYGCTETVPVEYESPEAFLVDFENACKENKNNPRDFVFAGKQWSADSFWNLNYTTKPILVDEFFPPDIFTVDEWFERHEQ